MLPDRIELSTSPLTMECSTTELRQHARIRESAETAPTGGPILATRPPLAQARERPAGRRKRPKSAREAGGSPHWLNWGPIQLPISAANSRGGVMGTGGGEPVTGTNFRKPTAPCAVSAKSRPKAGIGDCSIRKRNTIYSDDRGLRRDAFETGPRWRMTATKPRAGQATRRKKMQDEIG